MTQVIAVRSIVAAAGRSVIAANLAFELASSGRRVALVDLDEVWPSLHRYFNLPQQQAAVLAGARLVGQGKLDANAIESLAVRLLAKGVGVDFFSGFGLNSNRDSIDYESLTGLIRHLGSRYDSLVLDAAAMSESRMCTTISGVATRQVIVTQVDAVNLGRFLDALPAFEQQTAGKATTELVINRMRASVLGARPEWQVQQVLRERTPFTRAVVIPDDPAFDAALLKGLPLRQLGGKSKALLAIGELAGRLQ